MVRAKRATGRKAKLDQPLELAKLREAAELKARAAGPGKPEGPRDLDMALQELRVHQLELEMQNEELRRAQLELDVTRARYFDLYDLAPVGYCTLNHVGMMLQANFTAVTMLGLTRAAAMGRGFSRFVEPQDQRSWHSLLQRVVAGGGPQSAELRLVRSDNEVFWAHLIVTAGFDAEGMPERRVVLSDVTNRRTAESGRRDGELRYRDLFSRAIDGIVVCATDGTVETVNESFRQMHGWELGDDLKGLNLRAADGSGVALGPEHMGRMLTGEVLTFELEHRHHDGHLFPVEASTSLIYAAGVPRFLGYYRDISERRRLQAALLQAERPR